MLSEVEMGQVHTDLPSAPETPENLGCSLIARMQSVEGHRQARAEGWAGVTVHRASPQSTFFLAFGVSTGIHEMFLP
jgi:hypothetical protein